MAISPGEIAPSQCSHSITVLPVSVPAGITYFFTITTRDIYGNLIHDARENTAVSITALYVDHDAWLSSLPGVSDLPNWEQIYGKDLAGVAVFNNKSAAAPDSTYSGQITIFRAGTFTLEIRVAGSLVRSSPLTGQIHVTPADIYAPACILRGLALQMTAGQSYTAEIQTRDFYSNNRKALMAESVQTWAASIVLLDASSSDATVIATGTLADRRSGISADDAGVFEVAFSPTLAGTSFKVLLSINGLEVDVTADYRSKPLVVLPAPITSAAHSNYTILAETRQSRVQYVDQEASRSYAYVAGDSFKVLIDARDRFGNLRYASSEDQLLVELTGQATGGLVSGLAVPLGNGSYLAKLPLQVAEPYDLSIKLSSTTPIVGSPLQNKIAVRGGLVQAAYTGLVMSFSRQTAGVNYTYEIQAQDIFHNIEVNTRDKIDLEILGPKGASSALTYAHVEYRFALYAATFSLLQQGAYSAVVRVTQKGGLLATYYTTVDFASPVLLRSLHGHSAAVGDDPYSVSAQTGDSTHFTRLDEQIDFDLGRLSLLGDLIPATISSYPTQYFSVVWRGFVMAPKSSLYRIYIDSFEAPFYELILGGETKLLNQFKPEREPGPGSA